MNASKVISGSIIGTYHQQVKLGKFTYKLYQPTIKDLCTMLVNTDLSINDSLNKLEIISRMPEHIEECALLLSYAVSLKNGELYRKGAYHYILNFATMDQIAEAVQVFAGVVSGRELFTSVKKDNVSSKESKTETIGGNSIFGAISALVEDLHLSYTDVFEKIPYPCLLLMHSDKIRVLSPGDQVKKEMSDDEAAEFINRKLNK